MDPSGPGQQREGANRKGVLSQPQLGPSRSTQDLEVTGRESVTPGGSYRCRLAGGGWEGGTAMAGDEVGGKTSSLWGKEGRWLTGWKGQHKIASGKEVRGWARVLGRCIISVWSFRISRATGVQTPPGGQKEPQAHHLKINKGTPSSFFSFLPQHGGSSQGTVESGEGLRADFGDKVGDEGKGMV